MKNFLLFSFLFHGAVILGFVFVPDSFLNFFPKGNKISLVQDSVKVDLVGMPDKTLKEQKSLKQINKKQPKIETKKIVSKKVETEVESDQNLKVIDKSKKKIEKKSAEVKKKLKKVQKNEDKIDKKALSALDELVHMGNKISKGESLDSKKVSLKELAAFDKYTLKVKEKIKIFWELPVKLLGSKHKCEVQVFINNRGKLIRTKFIKKSKNEEFNNIVLRIIKRASPFPIPDKRIVKRVRDGDIGLGLPF